jgi:hypothetical protein
MAETRKAYRNTRTDAVRLSTKPLGFPYVPVDEPKAKADAKAKDAKDAKGDD